MAFEANSRVLSGFLDYLRIEKGLARNSIAAYTTDILQFAEFLEKHKRLLLTAQRSDVREFLQQLFSNLADLLTVGGFDRRGGGAQKEWAPDGDAVEAVSDGAGRDGVDVECDVGQFGHVDRIALWQQLLALC